MSTTKISAHVIEGGAITASHLSNVTTAHVTEGSNLYHTTARARSAISVTGGFLSYDSGTGVLSHDSTPTFVSINSTSDFTLDSGGDIVLDADGGDIRFKDGGTEIGVFENSSSNLQIKASVQDKDIIFRGNDGGSGVNALVLDMSAGGEATFNSNLNTLGGITVGDSSADVLRFVGILKQGSGTGTTVIDASRNLTVNDATVGGNLTVTGNLTINGTTTTINSTTLDVDDLNITVAKGSGSSSAANGGGLTIDGAGASMTWDHGNQYFEFNKDVFSGNIIVGTTGTKVGRLTNSSGVFNIEAYSTRQIAFGNADNGEHVRIDADGRLLIGTSVSLHGSADLQIQGASGNYARILMKDRDGTNQNAFIDATVGNLVLTSQNGTSHGPIRFSTYDGTDTLERMRVHSTGHVGINTTSPGRRFTVQGASGDNLPVRIIGGASTTQSSMEFTDPTTTADYKVVLGSKGDHLFFQAGGSERMRINSAGNIGIGTSGPNESLHITRAGDASIRLQNTSASQELRIDQNSIRTTTNSNISIFTNGNTGQLYLNQSNGLVGIGTSSPAAKLHISGNSDVSDEDCMLIIDDVDGSAGSRIPAIMFRSNTGGSVTNQARIRGTDTQGLVMSGSSALGDDLVVQSGGVGIGTTSVSHKLEVNGTARFQGAITSVLSSSGGSFLSITHTGNESWSFDAKSGSGSMDYVDFGIAGSTRAMTWQENGYVGVGTTAPLEKFDVHGKQRLTQNVVSNSTYQFLAFGSNRSIDDYGGLNKDYWRLNVVTPGPNTTGGSSAHSNGALTFAGVTGSNTTYVNRMSIHANGNVGIGTDMAVPSAKLQVRDSIRVGGSQSAAGSVYISDTSTTDYTLGIIGTGTRTYEFRGSDSGADYNSKFTNHSSGKHNLHVDGYVSIEAGQRLYLDSSGDTYFVEYSANEIGVYTGGAQRAKWSGGNYLPGADASYNLGAANLRWNNVYSADLHLSNEDTGGNEVDGTEGNWTIQEGEENLYIINNKSGKKYKFALEEIE